MRETVVSLISKEEYFKFITNNLTKGISERIVRVLESYDEIILKKPVLRVSEYLPTNSVEYRKVVDWKPLVRCKDCEFYTAEEKFCRRLGLCGAFDGEGFCSHGERREANEID